MDIIYLVKISEVLRAENAYLPILLFTHTSSIGTIHISRLVGCYKFAIDIFVHYFNLLLTNDFMMTIIYRWITLRYLPGSVEYWPQSSCCELHLAK